jgi:hypothetical protein
MAESGLARHQGLPSIDRRPPGSPAVGRSASQSPQVDKGGGSGKLRCDNYGLARQFVHDRRVVVAAVQELPDCACWRVLAPGLKSHGPSQATFEPKEHAQGSVSASSTLWLCLWHRSHHRRPLSSFSLPTSLPFMIVVVFVCSPLATFLSALVSTTLTIVIVDFWQPVDFCLLPHTRLSRVYTSKGVVRIHVKHSTFPSLSSSSSLPHSYHLRLYSNRFVHPATNTSFQNT